jgi:L-fuconolactonase
MRIDSHQHFWRYDQAAYPWIQRSMAVLRRDFLPADLLPLLADTGIEGTIAVQAQQTVDETRWLLDLAAAHDAIHGVVGWAPLVDPAVDRVLAELSDDRYMLREDFNRGLAQVVRYGLVYDILIFPKHLSGTLELVDRHPRQQFVVDHVAKPAMAGARFDRDWARDLRELAKRPYVACKLSGMVTEIRDASWTADLLRPYLDTALETFGAERLLFGTDWPVCLLRCSYADWVTLVEDLIAGLSASEQRAIMGDNASRIYRLGS